MAARYTGDPRTKRKPSKTPSQPRVTAPGSGCTSGSRASCETKISCPTAATPRPGEALPVHAMSPPASAGPVTAASWKEDEIHALALANSAGESRRGRMVAAAGIANARAAPTTASSP